MFHASGTMTLPAKYSLPFLSQIKFYDAKGQKSKDHSKSTPAQQKQFLDMLAKKSSVAVGMSMFQGYCKSAPAVECKRLPILFRLFYDPSLNCNKVDAKFTDIMSKL